MDSSPVQEALGTVLWILRPIGIALYYIGIVLLSVLQLLSGPVITALQPFIYLLYIFYIVASFPFTLIAKLEPVYNYIGAAVIFGGLIGLALNYSFHRFDEQLNLDGFLASLPGQQRSVKQYRESKAKKEVMDAPMTFDYTSLSDSMGTTSTRSKKSKNLLDQTIHEEDDSDF